ncbi:thioredoxin reductase [Acetobacter nitrogenifigens DSM 23921 = NBRC 105050]|uniref:Thioredoxin reductase n=2 Tax=Acetobacter nitrogenifigens TaxID=285268 RepID=A0A511XDF1_9PROT|nr:NAD(P)/FAD-dependent oxidoreductase [Acetobacter nitrogenifigens]GBQ97213.1 thioredoxin reductase [Acetobacter nitrogenifigens DSM 23921 = NBRC 105050]GEN60982.1 thioredoxin reductase [Acetobacter nitrogenifigens DSM 23921 = NBRC 105050]
MQFDAIVIGGSFAGLSAAIHIARARRRVCVIDTGRPRNRFASASHGFFGQDGAKPSTMIDAALTQVRRYPTTRVMAGEAQAARAIPGGFDVTVSGGETLSASRLVLAFGISDLLPNIDGLAERWGSSVLHCPYCHGYEFAEKRLGVLYSSPLSIHQALLIADWGPTTLYLDGKGGLDDDSLEQLARRRVFIEARQISRLNGEQGELHSLSFVKGEENPIDALYVTPHWRLNSPIAQHLGCALDDCPLGPLVRTDEKKETSVHGVYAAGDIARAPHNASWAAADGVTAGIFLHQSLVFAPFTSLEPK